MNRKDIAAIAVLALIAAGILGYMEFRPDMKDAAPEISAAEISYTLSIEGVAAPMPQHVPEGTSALGALERASQSSAFEMRRKEYSGLGILVEKIGAFENGADGRYWQYSVNGKFAPVGADQYAVQGGDVIEWKFARPESE